MMAGVTKITGVPVVATSCAIRQTGKPVTSVTPDTIAAPVDAVETLAQIERLLGQPAWEEEMTGVAASQIVAERAREVANGLREQWLLTKWRLLRAIDFASLARLTGGTAARHRHNFQRGRLPAAIEPVSGSAKCAIEYALLLGFSADEIQRARNKELVFLQRCLVEVLGAT